MPASLTGFLLARFVGDEEAFKDSSGTDIPHSLVQFLLVDLAAKRRIVESRSWAQDELLPTATPGRFDRVTVRTPYSLDDEELFALLALPYADHPDYREEWNL